MAGKGKAKTKPIRQKFSWNLMWKQRYLLMMSVPFVIWLIIFKYIPLWGWTMAFQEVKPASFSKSFFEREFVGFENFIKAFNDRLFDQTMINTIGISLIGLVLGTVMSVLFAILLNELVFSGFKKLTQTVSYLPHFVSWVIIASIAKNFLNDGGVIDTMVGTRLQLMSTNSPLIWLVIVLIEIWKETGWNAIIYLSAIAGIDTGLYEAAKVDGANRFQRIWHINVPVLMPTVIILLILQVGSLLGVGYEKAFLLQNSPNISASEIISTYVYKVGLEQADFSFGTAAGIFNSLVNTLLLCATNWISKKVTDTGLF